MTKINPTHSVLSIDSKVDEKEEFLPLDPVEDSAMEKADFINGVKAIVGGFIL
jgi:hypothetical protein